MNIPFNKPYLVGSELANIQRAHAAGQLSGDGPFTKYCEERIKELAGTISCLLTHSCTAALEMCALLADIEEGDEVIMPSYTFVSTANAFVLRGGRPVFVDIKEKDLNLDEELIEAAITSRTKAIVPVHYGGNACEMGRIMEIADRYELLVIEDAAQGFLSSKKNKALGSIGHLAAYSFHETKNIISGEGGAILINDSRFIERAEIIREKGTNRSTFSRGLVSKYRWVDKGSSFLPGEIIAAFLAAQLDNAHAITKRRKKIWDEYYQKLHCLEEEDLVILPHPSSEHNAHMFYMLFRERVLRDEFISRMKCQGILCVFHYIPLHSSPYGREVGSISGELNVTDSVADRIVRLPLWIGIEDSQDYIIDCTIRITKDIYAKD